MLHKLEFSEGSSGKFWEVEAVLAGKACPSRQRNPGNKRVGPRWQGNEHEADLAEPLQGVLKDLSSPTLAKTWTPTENVAAVCPRLAPR